MKCPEKLFDVCISNMGQNFPQVENHFDPSLIKILKPDDWEEKYAPRRSYQEEQGR